MNTNLLIRAIESTTQTSWSPGNCAQPGTAALRPASSAPNILTWSSMPNGEPWLWFGKWRKAMSDCANEATYIQIAKEYKLLVTPGGWVNDVDYPILGAMLLQRLEEDIKP